MNVAGKSLEQWRDFARTDDCLQRMVPSDLRLLVAELGDLRRESIEVADELTTRGILSLANKLRTAAR